METDPIDFAKMHRDAGEPGCNCYCNPAKGIHAYVMYSVRPYADIDIEVIEREYHDLGVFDLKVVGILPCREPGPFNPSGLIGNLLARNPFIVRLQEKEM